MCDYAVGLSRQLNGSIIPSERKLVHYVHNNSYFNILLNANLNSLINYKKLCDIQKHLIAQLNMLINF